MGKGVKGTGCVRKPRFLPGPQRDHTDDEIPAVPRHFMAEGHHPAREGVEGEKEAHWQKGGAMTSLLRYRKSHRQLETVLTHSVVSQGHALSYLPDSSHPAWKA